MLVTRFLKALPYADAVQDYYLCSKQSNELLRVCSREISLAQANFYIYFFLSLILQIGLNIAETCVSTVASPFVNKYVKIDHFASKQFNKVNLPEVIDYKSERSLPCSWRIITKSVVLQQVLSHIQLGSRLA